MGLNGNLEKVSQECTKLKERFKLLGDLHEEIQGLLSGEEQAQDHQVYINLHEEIVPFREEVQKWMTNAEQQFRDEEGKRIQPSQIGILKIVKPRVHPPPPLEQEPWKPKPNKLN